MIPGNYITQAVVGNASPRVSPGTPALKPTMRLGPKPAETRETREFQSQEMRKRNFQTRVLAFIPSVAGKGLAFSRSCSSSVRLESSGIRRDDGTACAAPRQSSTTPEQTPLSSNSHASPDRIAACKGGRIRVRPWHLANGSGRGKDGGAPDVSQGRLVEPAPFPYPLDD